MPTTEMAMSRRSERLSAADVAKLTAAVALAAIFVDAAVGHGLTWENDPYWTYWVTKTFLIATIFGLGTAWFGMGPGRGAVITAVHTLVLRSTTGRSRRSYSRRHRPGWTSSTPGSPACRSTSESSTSAIS